MIKAIIFDLDGTLYRSKIVERQLSQAAYHTLAKFTNIDYQQARKVVEERRSNLSKKKGYRIPYTHTLGSFGVPPAFWHKENVKYFNAQHYLKKNRNLINVLKQLKKHYLLAVVTNNNRIQTERILKALGIKQLFNVIQSFTDCNLLKPDPKVFVRVAKKLRVKHKECLSVGDRIDIDLIPALTIGMKTFRVASPRGINSLLKLKRIFSK